MSGTGPRAVVHLTLERDFVRGVLMALVAGLLLAFTGAFGMDDTPFRPSGLR